MAGDTDSVLTILTIAGTSDTVSITQEVPTVAGPACLLATRTATDWATVS